MLADAFQDDPLWNKVLHNTTMEQRNHVFETPIRYCLHYGEVWAPSGALEGVIAWVPPTAASLTSWKVVRSGALWSGLRLGIGIGRRMQLIFRQIGIDRKRYIRDKPSIYLQIIGVSNRFQGQGFGGILLRSLIRKSSEIGFSIYLETETETNVSLYEHHGFVVLKKLTLPIIDVPMWEMVREVETEKQ